MISQFINRTRGRRESWYTRRLGSLQMRLAQSASLLQDIINSAIWVIELCAGDWRSSTTFS
jgi:hypothetical protein